MIKVQLKRIYKFNLVYITKMEGYINLYFYIPKLGEIIFNRKDE